MTELSNPNVYGTVEGLKTHPLWTNLTMKQQVFVEELCKGTSRVDAVRTAYNVGTDASAATMASRLMMQYTIRTLLSAHWGVPMPARQLTRRELLSLMSTRLRQDIGQMEFRTLSTIYADLKGWRKVKLGRPTKLKEPAEGEVAEPLDNSEEMLRLIQQYERESNEEGSEDEG